MQIPANATRIGRGRYLMPGMAEMHAHIPGGNAPDVFLHRVLALFVANGVTTIRGMLGDPRHLPLRAAVSSGAAIGPTIFTSGPSFNGNSVTSPEVGVKMVQDQKAAGYDFLEIHPGVSRRAFDAVAAEANRLNLPFSGHVPADVGLERALAAKFRSIDHIDGYFEYAVRADAPVDKTTPGFIPPQVVEGWVKQRTAFMASSGFAKDVNDRILKERRALLKSLHDAGVDIVMGSDAIQTFSVPGFSLHNEMRAMANAGLTPYQIYVTGTRNVARFFGRDDEVGLVGAGKVADLVLLEANPLSDVANFGRQTGTFTRGRWHPRDELITRIRAMQ